MGAFINSGLISGEEVVYETKLHWIMFLAPTIWTIILLPFSREWPFLLVIAAAIWLLYWLNRRNSEIGVTNKRVLIKTGIISRKVIDMPLGKVESQNVTQGIFDRMVGAGTLHFRGAGSTPATLKNIDQPFALSKALNEAIDAMNK